tara:strand:+ start:320 stop:1066 length:747 start_codon:yes stop_codon:yes gene_type:complete
MVKLKIRKVRDTGEKFYTDKGPVLPPIPLRALAVGRSQSSGKTNLGVALFSDKNLYGNDYSGDDIYIFSNSLNSDEKLKRFIKFKKIPADNLFDAYDEELITELYNNIYEDYTEAIRDKEKPKNVLLYLDDIAFSGAFKKNRYGTINRIFSNGRHILLSIFITLQSYTSALTSIRENANAIFLFSMSNRQLDLVADDHAITSNKLFKRMFRDATKEKYSFMLINYNNPAKQRFINKDFEVLDIDKYDK